MDWDKPVPWVQKSLDFMSKVYWTAGTEHLGQGIEPRLLLRPKNIATIIARTPAAKTVWHKAPMNRASTLRPAPAGGHKAAWISVIRRAMRGAQNHAGSTWSRMRGMFCLTLKNPAVAWGQIALSRSRRHWHSVIPPWPGTVPPDSARRAAGRL